MLLTLLTAAVALSATSASATVKAEAAKPVIRITQLSPLVVKGERFRRAERIVIRVTASSQTRTRTMRTSQRGTFTASFSGVSGDRCSGSLSVVVTTADGRVAKTRRPDFLCPPAIP